MRAWVLLCLLSVLVLAGCGSGESVQPLPEDVEGDVPAATEPAETEGPATTEEPTEPAETGDGGAAAEGDPETGAEVFAQAGCGACHTLEEAGTTATIGPNLDEAAPSFDEVVQVVRTGSPPMPAFADQLSDEEIRDVAAFVVSATGG